MSAALALDRVSKTRGVGPQAVLALNDVSLSVAAGEFILLQGPSGSGKTTVLLLAAGLLGADRGVVTLAGRALGDMTAAALRRWRSQHLGFVFQRANLLSGLRVRENVMLPALLRGSPPEEARQRCDDLLAELGMTAHADRRPRELSGGEEQRVAVARALVHRPTAVLADEPTANLDWRAGQVVADCLRRLARELGSAVLVSTHDPRLEPYADRRIRIEDGQLGS